REAGFDLDLRAESAPQELGDSDHELIEVRRLRLERLAAREGEQALGELGPALRRADGVARELAALGIRRQTLLQDLHVAKDHGEQVVEVVRDAARQAADRLQLLR